MTTTDIPHHPDCAHPSHQKPAPQPALDAGEQWYMEQHGDVFTVGRKHDGRIIACGNGDKEEQRRYMAQIVRDHRSAAAVPKLVEALKAAVHAMKSYQYGNSSNDLAKGIETAASTALMAVGEKL
jgi:hypothetical protein